MASGPVSLSTLEYYAATAERWQDLETLFGASGAYGGCWYIWWRLTRSEFGKQTDQGNKGALKAIVDAGESPGLLAYVDGQPIT